MADRKVGKAAQKRSEQTLIKLQHMGMNPCALNQFINLSASDQDHISDLLDYCEERARKTIEIEMDMQEAGPDFDQRRVSVRSRTGENP